MDLLERMLGHDRWTTEQLLTLSQGLSDDQLDQPFDIGRRTLRATFDHMLDAVELWTGLMGDETAPQKSAHGSVEAMLARHTHSRDRFELVARELIATSRLDETFIDHHDYPQSYGATILQVTWHNTLHRSEVLHMLQRLGMSDLPDGDPQEWEHRTGRI
ncbi:hypothetical protein BH20CHL2_BH20CHL2_12910 [soil metagenome]